MSSSAIARQRRFILNWGNTNRNAFDIFLLGESTGVSGYSFPEQGIVTKLTLILEITGFVTPGTITATIYKDGGTSSDDVFSVSFGIAANGSLKGTDIVPEVTPTPDFGTGTQWFVRLQSSGAPAPSYGVTYSVLVEGYFLA